MKHIISLATSLLLFLNGISQDLKSTVILSKPLSAGWTWFSINVIDTDMSVDHVLGSLTGNDGDYIKNQTVSATYYEGVGWFGELLEIDPGEMYKIKIAAADEIIFEGLPADPLTYPVTINTGWNWIGYLPQSAKGIIQSLSGIIPVANDYIKNQTVSSTFIEGDSWFGDLTNMEPGDGYMLKTSHPAILTFPVFGTFTDARDNYEYPWIKIGDQIWMSGNLAWLPTVDPPTSGWPTYGLYYVEGYSGTVVSEAKNSGSFASYGVLYNREAAKIACPSGWHWPSDAEWTTLSSYFSATDGGKMKEQGTGHWTLPNTGGTNESGLTALPGGYRSDLTKDFEQTGNNGYYWTSTVSAVSEGWYRGLYFNSNEITRLPGDFSDGYSVRCIFGRDTTLPTLTTAVISGITQNASISGGNITKDGGIPVTARGVCWSLSSNPTTSDNKTTDGDGTGEFISAITALDAQTTYYVRAYAINNSGTSYGNEISFTTLEGNTFADSRDGHIYKKVTIGTQTWMAENLAYLPAISALNTGSNTAYHYYVYAFYGSTVASAKASVNYATYGVLYNWPGAMVGNASSSAVPSGIQAICPPGWHLPSDAEWTILTDFLNLNGYGYGGTGVDVAKSMASTTLWSASATLGAVGNDLSSNNTSGFNALPGGTAYYLVGGGCQLLKDAAYFWSATGNDATTSWIRALNYGRDYVSRYANYNYMGHSVRCLKD